MNVWTYWRCEHCDSIIRGDSKKCPNCGGGLQPGQKYMMPDNPEIIKAIKNGKVLTGKSEIVTDVVTTVSKSQENFEANWMCDYCGEQNDASNSTCCNCGSAKTDAERDYFNRKPHITYADMVDYKNRTGMDYQQSESHYENEETPHTSAENDYKPTQTEKETTHEEPVHKEPIHEELVNEDPVYGQQNTEVHKEPTLTNRILDYVKENGQSILKYTGITAAIILALWFFVWLFTPIEKSSNVVGFEWQRTIPIEEFQLCHESGWSLPSDATLEYTREEISHYEQVIDHYETKSRQVSEQVLDGYDTEYRDLGNGQAEVVQTPKYRTEYHTEYYKEPVYRKEPVYETKYYYTVDRWKTVDSAVTSATDHSPYWAETELSDDISNPDYGDRREGTRSETYWVLIRDEKNNIQRIVYIYDQWKSVRVGDKITYYTFRFSDRSL